MNEFALPESLIICLYFAPEARLMNRNAFFWNVLEDSILQGDL